MKPGKHTPFPSSAKLKAGRAAAADEGIWLGLVSLMLYAQPRRDARRDTQGEYAPLAEQEAARWDATLIEEAEALRLRASTPPGTGRYPLPATRYPLAVAVESAPVVCRRGLRAGHRSGDGSCGAPIPAAVSGGAASQRELGLGGSRVLFDFVRDLLLALRLGLAHVLLRDGIGVLAAGRREPTLLLVAAAARQRSGREQDEEGAGRDDSAHGCLLGWGDGAVYQGQG